eukprot:m.30358 g.30358  ORF g.30358 m.30358 type:complete len:204 (+) comp9273_c0_seq1:199-810(+)
MGCGASMVLTEDQLEILAHTVEDHCGIEMGTVLIEKATKIFMTLLSDQQRRFKTLDPASIAQLATRTSLSFILDQDEFDPMNDQHIAAMLEQRIGLAYTTFKNMPQIKYNPFQEQMFRVFCEREDMSQRLGDLYMPLQHFLVMVAVFGDSDTETKASYAYTIYSTFTFAPALCHSACNRNQGQLNSMNPSSHNHCLVQWVWLL